MDSHRNLGPVPTPELPAVEVAEPGTVPMTDDQYTAAVKALGVLISQWRSDQATNGPADGDRPSAA